MSRVDRISSRLPRFYRHWEEGTLISAFLRAVSVQLDAAEDKLTDGMKAHWADAATGEDLDRLAALLGIRRFAEEGDVQLKARLKTALEHYRGGGTLSSILDAVRRLLGTKGDQDVKITENPPAPCSAEFQVRAGETWTLRSRGVSDAQPTITISVEEGGEVSDPTLTNLDTDESIALKGKLGSGRKLVLEEGKATLDGKDVSRRVSPDKLSMPPLLRGGSTWGYNESLGALVGVFDRSKFDEHTFAVGVPPVKIRFEWTRLRPAAFEVQVRSKVLKDSGFSKAYLESLVNSMKAAGVSAAVKVSG